MKNVDSVRAFTKHRKQQLGCQSAWDPKPHRTLRPSGPDPKPNARAVSHHFTEGFHVEVHAHVNAHSSHSQKCETGGSDTELSALTLVLRFRVMQVLHWLKKDESWTVRRRCKNVPNKQEHHELALSSSIGRMRRQITSAQTGAIVCCKRQLGYVVRKCAK